MSRAKPTAGAFAAAVARNRHQLYDLVVRAVRDSGMSQVQLAEWAGISPEHMSRILRRPRNIEWDTASRLLFAAQGATVRLTLALPKATKAAEFQTETVRKRLREPGPRQKLTSTPPG